MSYEDVEVYLLAAEAANRLSVVGELNKAMNLAKKLSGEERKKCCRKGKRKLPRERGVPFDHPDL